MKAAVYMDKMRVEAKETALPEIGSGDILLRVCACGVCGTDIQKIRHGTLKPPAILGHEVAGEVIKVGAGVQKFVVGDRVVVAHHTPCYVCHYCRHENYSMCRTFKASNLDPGGFAEFVRVPQAHVEMTAHRIPEGMSFEQAIHMEPLACVLRNVKRAKLLPGDTVLIIGLGSVGLLTGQVLKRIPCKVIGADLKPERLELAKQLKFDLTLNGKDPALEKHIQRITEQRGVDLVVLTAGNARLYSKVARFVRDGGAINIFAGLEPGAKGTYDLNEIYRREITIYSSYSPSPAELKEALEHLQAGTIQVDILNPKPFALAELPQAIEAVMNQSILKAVIRPQERQT